MHNTCEERTLLEFYHDCSWYNKYIIAEHYVVHNTWIELEQGRQPREKRLEPELSWKIF